MSGQDQIPRQIQKAEMSPVAGVKFLRVLQQVIFVGSQIELRRKVRDIGEALFFIDNQIFNDRQVLGGGLLNQMRRCIPIRARIVHVDMSIPTNPARVRTLPLDLPKRNRGFQGFTGQNV